jgi:putative sterol carrier protein
MNPLEAEKRKLIKTIFEKMVPLINKEMNIDEFKETYFPDEDRTLQLNIIGLEDLDTGFVFENGEVRIIAKIYDKPTVILTMDEDTFILISTKRLTFAEAFFNGDLEMEGENYLRDYRIFERTFTKYGKILDKIKN